MMPASARLSEETDWPVASDAEAPITDCAAPPLLIPSMLPEHAHAGCARSERAEIAELFGSGAARMPGQMLPAAQGAQLLVVSTPALPGAQPAHTSASESEATRSPLVSAGKSGAGHCRATQSFGNNGATAVRCCVPLGQAKAVAPQSAALSAPVRTVTSPGAQGLHCRAPSSSPYELRGQATHTPAQDPGPDQKVPRGQAVHEVALLLLQRPGPHEAHAPVPLEFEKVPAAHTEHEAATGCDEKEPGGQASQAAELDKKPEPGRLRVPLGQAVHCRLPITGAKEPCAQGAHCGCPAGAHAQEPSARLNAIDVFRPAAPGAQAQEYLEVPGIGRGGEGSALSKARRGCERPSTSSGESSRL